MQMRTLTRWEPFRGATSLQDQVNRLFNDVLERKGEESSLTAWAPGTPEPITTALSYTNDQNSSTGTVLPNGVFIQALTSDVQIVIDLQGYYIAPPPPGPTTVKLSA